MTTFKPPKRLEIHDSLYSIRKRKSTDFIVVHCSATLNRQEYDWKYIDRIHRSNGWLCIGYHFVILRDGTIQNGRPIDSIGAHVKGYNEKSIGICLIGGIDRNGDSVDNFTVEQKNSLRELIDWLRSIYTDAEVLGHRDFPDVAKDCPCFDVIPWYGKGATYVNYDGQLNATLEKYNISRAIFEEFNGNPEELIEGQLIRVS